jgi:hypothetical protein
MATKAEQAESGEEKKTKARFFLSALLFHLSHNHQQNEAMTEIYVSKDSVKATDVICRRGAGANSHPGNFDCNIYFHDIIHSNFFLHCQSHCH